MKAHFNIYSFNICLHLLLSIEDQNLHQMSAQKQNNDAPAADAASTSRNLSDDKGASPSLPHSEAFFVHGLDKVIPAYADFDGKMYAGTLPVNNGDRTGETMFWLFEPAEQLVSTTLVIWLNGGPVS